MSVGDSSNDGLTINLGPYATQSLVQEYEKLECDKESLIDQIEQLKKACTKLECDKESELKLCEQLKAKKQSMSFELMQRTQIFERHQKEHPLSMHGMAIALDKHQQYKHSLNVECKHLADYVQAARLTKYEMHRYLFELRSKLSSVDINLINMTWQLRSNTSRSIDFVGKELLEIIDHICID